MTHTPQHLIGFSNVLRLCSQHYLLTGAPADPCDAACLSTVLVDLPLFELWFRPLFSGKHSSLFTLLSGNHSFLFTLSHPVFHQQPYITKQGATVITAVTCLLTVLLGLALVNCPVVLISAVFLRV